MKPTDYTPQLGDIILGGVSRGDDMAALFAQEDMPDRSTFIRWCAEQPAFFQQCQMVKQSTNNQQPVDNFEMQELYAAIPGSEGLPSTAMPTLEQYETDKTIYGLGQKIIQPIPLGDSHSGNLE